MEWVTICLPIRTEDTKKGVHVFLNNGMIRTSNFQVSKLCLKVKGGPGLTAYSIN